MRFVHAFWSKPLFEEKFNKYAELIGPVICDYAYSFACIKQFGHTIRLFADEKGAELLSFIPYDEVIILDTLDNQNIHFAAQTKFEALQKMELDEILIDGDLFIRRAEAYEMIDSIQTDVLYSFYEPSIYTIGPNNERAEYYEKIKNALIANRKFFKPPYTIDTDYSSFTWPNTSLLKFGNQEMKDEYIRQYYYHKKVLEKYDFGNVWPDIWIEQKHLDKLIKSGYKARPLVYGFPSTTANNYGVFIGFVHLGGAKMIQHPLVVRWLQELNPTLYSKAENQLKKYSTKP